MLKDFPSVKVGESNLKLANDSDFLIFPGAGLHTGYYEHDKTLLVETGIRYRACDIELLLVSDAHG